METNTKHCAVIAKIQVGESVTFPDAPGTIFVGVDKRDEVTHYVWVAAGSLPWGEAERAFPNAVAAFAFACHVARELVLEEYA